ncbi:MAG: NAD(P)/FAD-dependent oxidoreductase [Planctomycetaceae bacterium]|nr:NAD(P)/FAD-dependent oxidoreductase [Planctomycetaceae bacterium]
MPNSKPKYDAVIIGSGHNGLVAACYLAKAGKSVLILERNAELGGATQSRRVFDGVDARLSVYSYLVSLLPEKIVNDLGLNVTLKPRQTASWTPAFRDGAYRELLVRNDDPDANRQAFFDLTGDDRDYRGYLELQQLSHQIASVVWPSLTEPLATRRTLRDRMGSAGDRAWQALIEEPLGVIIEELIQDDLIRGMVFTDGRIGVSTWPHDPGLLQNRSFLYHVIGRGTGEWRVPVGGMGALTAELIRVAQSTGRVDFQQRARVTRLHSTSATCSLEYEGDDQQQHVDARVVLCNASADVLAELTGAAAPEASLEGAGFKMNMVLERLPRLRSPRYTAAEAFAGTVHIDEGYEQMIASYQETEAGQLPTTPPGEIYCHTLTDSTILSDDLNERGFHTITLFGLDLPYRVFQQDNDRLREHVMKKFLAGINQFLAEPIEDCLAKDARGDLCVEAMSAVDLERNVHLPRGNIFHGDLTWPFVETQDEAGAWGVETTHENILLCGSAARRGGAVSGIPGHNAAQKALELLSAS